MAAETREFHALKRCDVPLEMLFFVDNFIDSGYPADPEATS